MKLLHTLFLKKSFDYEWMGEYAQSWTMLIRMIAVCVLLILSSFIVPFIYKMLW